MQLKSKSVSSGLIQRTVLFSLVTLLALLFNNFSGLAFSGVAQATPALTSPAATQAWPEGLYAAYAALHPRVSSLAQAAEITAQDNATSDNFGYAVSVSSDGSTALIGAYFHQVGSNSQAGAAYIFGKSGSSWNQLQELTASDNAAGEEFGFTVSLSSDGSTALIGSTYHTVGSNSQAGAAYIFGKSGSSWTQLQELTAQDNATSDHFGHAVSLSSDGSTALIGSYFHKVGSNSQAGAAYIFGKSGSSWTQLQELTASDNAAADNFGRAVSLSSDGSTALIGADGHQVGSHIIAGAAYIFGKSGSSWTQLQELTAQDNAAGDNFGWAVSLSSNGSTALVGSPFHKVGSNSHAGAAYIFGKSGSSWTQLQELTASDNATNDFFSSSVSLSSDGSTALIGSPFHKVGSNSNAGAAYIFGKSGSSWTQLQELTASDNAANDEFGFTVSLSSDGSTALIGAINHKVGSNSNAGAAYIFSPLPTTTTLSSSPNPSLLGTNVTFTATVAPALAIGSVTFKDGATVLGIVLGTGTLSGGVATYTTSSLSGGQPHHLGGLWRR